MSAPTGNKVFAPAIFFIAFREALEASLVIGILTGTLENVVGVKNSDPNGRALVKKLRKYVSTIFYLRIKDHCEAYTLNLLNRSLWELVLVF